MFFHIALLYFPVHIVSCALAFGISFAYWQRHFPDLAKEDYQEDKQNSFRFSVFGPFSLIMTFIFSGFAHHGLKFK